MNGKAPTNGAGRAGLRATLRKSGWIDPEYVNRKPLPRTDPSADFTTAGTDTEPLATEPVSTTATTLPNPSSTPEGTDMSSTTDSAPMSEPTVVEEAWAHTKAGHVSASIKEQLLSDGSIRYRCAHPRGGGCHWTHATVSGVVGHQRSHSYVPTAPPVKPASWRQAAAQKRAAQAKDVIAQQARDMLTAAEGSGQTVRRSAIITAGMGAGQATDTVRIAVTPNGNVTFECADPGCGYSADSYGRVFGHRSWMHSKRRVMNTDHDDALAAPNGQDPVTQITANGTHADLPVPASAPPVMAAVRATALGAARAEALQRRSDPTDTELEPTAMTTTEATTEATAEATAEAIAATPGGSPFQEAAEYLREQCTQMVDHLRDMATAEYDHTAVLREQDADIERLKAHLAAALQARDTLQVEVDDLRAERQELIAARDQLEQLRGMFRKLGMAD